MVMPIFVAQNPQLSYTTPNISVLEVADPREPLTSSLETTYATPRQAAVGAPIDMAGKPSRTAIPHLARSIPLRLDDLCINTLPLCYRQHQSIPPDREEFFIRSHRPNQLRKYSCPDLDYGTSVHFTSPSGWQRLAQASVPNSTWGFASYGGKYILSPTTSLRMILTLHSLSPYSTPVCRGLCRPLPNQEGLDRHWKKIEYLHIVLGSFLFTLKHLLLTTAVRAYDGTTRTAQGIV